MSAPQGISPIEKLTANHQVKQFRCGKNSLDHFLRSHALKNQLAESSQTYVVHRDLFVLGYMTLAFGSVSLSEAPVSIAENLPTSYPVPVMILARWAVDKTEQKHGIGRSLVDALDDNMAKFYKEFGFIECPVGPRKLMMPIEVVRLSI